MFGTRHRPSSLRRRVLAGAVPAAIATVVVTAPPAAADVPLTQVSSDPYTDPAGQHRTQVEPDTFAFGDTIVSAFQTGRSFGGGATSIGFATSADGGATWIRGFLPGTTPVEGGPFNRISDPSVAYDAKHDVWLISSLGLGGPGTAVVTSRSTDGGRTWSDPVTTATGSLDKNWIVCDNTATSPFYGNCYTQFDVTSAGNAIRMSTSTDGGASWTTVNTSAAGLGGQPVVRPNGTVLVPYASTGGQIRSFRSINGGQSWRSTVLVANISAHRVAGGLRTRPLPSAETDAAGTAYVVWQDCRFRSGCPANDIVMSKSTSETTWGPVTRITSDAGDHFIPGIGVDSTTSGGAARIGLTYHRYPNADCSAATCRLTAAYTSSTNGGTSWSTPTELAGPMTLSWLADTSQGRMVGDYISTSIAGDRAWPVIEVANAPSGNILDEASYVPTGGLEITGGTRTAVTGPVRTTGHRPSRTDLTTAN